MASDQEWQDYGSCRRYPVEVFFPPAEQEADEAKAICETCAVREPCLEYALESDERFGVWGGLTPEERRALILRRRNRARATAAADATASL